MSDCDGKDCDIRGLCKPCWKNLGDAPGLRREIARLRAERRALEAVVEAAKEFPLAEPPGPYSMVLNSDLNDLHAALAGLSPCEESAAEPEPSQD